MIKRRTFLNLIGLGWLATASPKLIDGITVSVKRLLAFPFQSVIFYVAPNGNDSWSGKQSVPNASGTDGPFATITAARDAVRIKRQRRGIRQPVTIVLRGGTYFLTEPLVFTPEDSGTAEFPVTYAAYQDETPIISGGQLITGWKEVTLDGKQLWSADISSVEGEWFRQLWVNGQRRTRARYPNQGYLRVAEVPDARSQTQVREGQKRFRFAEGDSEVWRTVADADAAEVVVLNRWVESRLPITSVDESERLVTFSKRSVFSLAPGDSSSSGAAIYYIENAFELLDTPGEWYLDHSSGKLYYMPLPDEDITKAEVIAPVLSRLVDLQGNWKAGKFVEHLSWQDLTFAHAEWYYPQDFKAEYPAPDVGGFWQAAYGVPGAIFAAVVRHCLWNRCTIAHVSNYGIEFARVCAANQVSNCSIFDLGAGGVKMAENGGHQITDCHIYDGGHIFPSAVAIWSAVSSQNTIARNHIHDFYSSGISVGWTWGYQRNPTQGNVIESNHIHHLGLRSDGGEPILNDKGGIYTLGIQPGTKICSNVIHHIDSFNYGGWGIYLDEGSSQIVVEKNLVYETRDGGFHLHYGKANVVRNNVFAFGRNAQLRKSSQEKHLSLIFENNIVYWNHGKLLAGKWKDFKFEFDRNLYWQEDDQEISFAGLSWRTWQAKGMDIHSLIAPPLFIAPESGNFQLQSNSPAFLLGFEHLPIASESAPD